MLHVHLQHSVGWLQQGLLLLSLQYYICTRVSAIVDTATFRMLHSDD